MKKYEVSFPYLACYPYLKEDVRKTANEIVDANNVSEAFQIARNKTEQKEITIYKAHCLSMPNISAATIKETSQAAIDAELQKIFEDEQFKNIL